MLIDNSAFWSAIASDLSVEIEEKPYQFYDAYNPSTDNPLANVVTQLNDGFFGTKQLHLFIIGKPYGWSGGPGSWAFSWPSVGYEELRNFIIDKYDEWQKFQITFYGDQYLVDQVMTADPDSEFGDMMDQTFTQIQADIAVMSAYGWSWGGLLGDTANKFTFMPVINSFYS